jgi:hypothetical protein
VVTPVGLPLSYDDRRALAFATIELDNLIVVALRQYTKSCLLGTRTAAGARVVASVSPSTPEEAAAYIYGSLNPAAYQKKMKSPKAIAEKDEIVFRDPKQSEKVLIDYGASNLANLQLALSLNAVAFSEVKTCRHFFSHRMMNTSHQVEALATSVGIVGFEDPENFVAVGRPATGVRMIDGWLSDIENFFDLAA